MVTYYVINHGLNGFIDVLTKHYNFDKYMLISKNIGNERTCHF